VESDMEGVGYQEYVMGQILSPLPLHVRSLEEHFSENEDLTDDGLVDNSIEGEYIHNSLDIVATGNTDTTSETQAFGRPPCEVGLNPSHSQHNQEVWSRTKQIDPLPSEDGFIDDVEMEEGLIGSHYERRGRSPWSSMDGEPMLAGGLSYYQDVLQSGNVSARTPLETPKAERYEQRRDLGTGSPRCYPSTSQAHILYDNQARLERTPRSYPPITLQEPEDYILDDDEDDDDEDIDTSLSMLLLNSAAPHRQYDSGLQGQVNTEGRAFVPFSGNGSVPSRSYPPDQDPYPPRDSQRPRHRPVGSTDLPPWSATSRPRLFPVATPLPGGYRNERAYTSYTQDALDQGLIVSRAKQMSGDGARSG
jgi:hypothetical protein